MEETQAAFDLMSAKEKAEFMATNMAWSTEVDLKNELTLREEL